LYGIEGRLIEIFITRLVDFHFFVHMRKRNSFFLYSCFILLYYPTNVYPQSVSESNCSVNGNDNDASDGTCLVAATEATTDSVKTTTITNTGTNTATDNINDETMTICQNQHEHCEFWASKGECDNNPKFMLTNCQQACQSCNWDSKRLERVIKEKLSEKAAKDEASIDPNETPYGVQQQQDGRNETEQEQILARIQNVTNYMDTIVFVDPAYNKVKDKCRNR
jgi:hypothetical protein